MVLAVLLPLLAFAGVLLWHDVTRKYDIHRRGMLDTAQATFLAVDREWGTVRETLETLAASDLLDAGDWRAFYDLCTKGVEDLGDTGWGYGHTVEHVPVYSAWARSSVTRWITVISVTEASITSPIRRSLTL